MNNEYPLVDWSNIRQHYSGLGISEDEINKLISHLQRKSIATLFRSLCNLTNYEIHGKSCS